MEMFAGAGKKVIRLSIAIPVVAAALLSPSLSPTSHAQRGLDADTLAIEQVVIQAETAKETLYMAPNTAPGVAIAASEVQTAEASAYAELGALYSPGSSLLAFQTRRVGQWMAAQASGDNKLLAGGIRDATFGAVTSTGAAATAHLTFTTYAVYAVRQPTGSIVTYTPSSQIIADITLNKTDQGWRITNDSWQFAPGSEP